MRRSFFVLKNIGFDELFHVKFSDKPIHTLTKVFYNAILYIE